MKSLSIKIEVPLPDGGHTKHLRRIGELVDGLIETLRGEYTGVTQNENIVTRPGRYEPAQALADLLGKSGG